MWRAKRAAALSSETTFLLTDNRISSNISGSRKSMHWAVRVTSRAQSKSHCPPKRWPQSVVGGNEQMQHESLLLPKHGCCGCWKSPLGCSRPHPWTTPLWESQASLYSGAQTNEQIGLDEGNLWGLVEAAPSANGKDGALAHVQRCTQDGDSYWLRDQPRWFLWRDSQNAAKRHHQLRCANWSHCPEKCLFTANIRVSHRRRWTEAETW